MDGRRYPEEFKIEAVRQVFDRGHSVSSVTTRPNITTHSLYARIKKYGPDTPDERWVIYITYARVHEDWLYLTVVVNLFSRRIIGWSVQSRMTNDIVLHALLMAALRCNLQRQVLVHAD